MRGTSLPWRFIASAVCIVGLAGTNVPVASAAIQNRISSPASTDREVEIPNTVQPKVSRSSDLGPAPGNTKLQAMTLRFSMTADQQTALNQLLADLQNPSSPRYHQWLTPAQYAAQFGLSSADIAKVTAWLASQGFTVTGVAKGGTFVTFDGTVAQAQAAFGTSIHNVSYNGEIRFANVTNASVPTAFANVVTGITGLHNFRFKPRARTVSPNFTSSVSGNHYIAPGDIYTMYDVKPLLNSGIDGTGVTIAVTGQVDINLADITAFRSASGLSTTNLPTIVHEGGDPGPALSCTNCFPNQGDLDEASIDLEWSGAMAPGATLIFVNGPDVMANAMTQAIDQNLAPIITTSYGACEAGWGSTELNTLNQLFQQASAQGQTILAASGDDGGTDCDAGPSATQGLAVDFPGSSPYVTSMGGTQPNEGSGNYWNTTNDAAGGSAISYIPETVWNDASLSSFGGGGGGASGFFTKPTWQQGSGVPNDASRDVPDLALNATDNPTHGSFLYCVNVALGSSCTNGYRIANNNLTAAGGTSFDSQIFGGMLALIEQKIGSRIGNANPTIYALANNSTYYTPGATVLTNSNVVFNDVTAGNNQMTCTTGTPNCPTGGSIGYTTASGYDLASGWGSVNLYNLANAWKSVAPLGSGSNGTTTSATSLTASPGSVAAGASVTLTATVTGSAGTPTGTIQFLVNGAIVGSGTLNASGIATYTYATSCSNLAQLALPKLVPSHEDRQYASVGLGGSKGRSSGNFSWFGAGSGASVACLLLFILPRKRRLAALYLAIASIAIVGGASGCSGGGTVVPLSSSSTNSRNTTLILSASYSGNATYAGSIASGISAAGLTTSTSQVTPVNVTVTPGTCP